MQDQGVIGDCVYQTLRELMTGLALREGRGEVLYSSLAPYYWGREIDGARAYDDVGSSISTSMLVAQLRGLPHLDEWPDTKPFYVAPSPQAHVDAWKHRAVLAFALPNVATIKASLRDGFSVAIGFDCPKSLFSMRTLKTGEIELPDNPKEFEGDGHAVSIWAADSSRTIGPHHGAFYVNCHWGTDVGEAGYFWLPMAYLEKNRAADAHTMRLATEF